MTIVYKANRIEGLSTDTKPVDQYNGRIFYETDTNKSFIFQSGSWTELSSGASSEFNTFTTATTWNPSKQTGLGIIDIDTNNMTSGSLNLVIDGTTTNSLVSGETLNKFINPSSSLALTTAGANFSYNQFDGNVSGLYDYRNAGGLTYTIKDLRSYWFSDDGTKFYFLGRYDSGETWHIWENSVSSSNAWNFTTANDTYDGASSALPTSIFISFNAKVTGLKDSGTKMFVIDRLNNSSTTGNAVIYRFDWSTAYNATTCATSASNSMTVNDFSGQQIGMGWNNDGTKLFIYNQGNDTIYRYSLSTAWDLSTESLDSGQTKSGVGLSNFASNGIYFNSIGTKLYTRGFTGGGYAYYRTWTLSTAWDVTTLSSTYTSNFNTQGNGGQYGATTWNNTGYWVTDGNYDFWNYGDNGFIQEISETFGGTAYSSLT